MNLDSYKALLAAPPAGAGLAHLIFAYGLARLPVGINALALALVTQAATGSAASAGLVSAAYLVALGIQAPMLGRWIDTHGPQGTVGWTLCLHVPAMLAFAACAVAGKPAAWLVASAALAGAAMPPTSAIFRAILRKADLTDAQRHAAFALDAVLIELCFVVGPMIAAALVALKQPWLAVVVSGGIALMGSWGFVRSKAYLLWGKPSAQDARHWAGPLKLKAVRRVLWAMAAFALGVGCVEMGLTAAANAFGKPQAVGWAFAALSVTSAVVGLWYGTAKFKAPNGKLFAWATAWLGAGALGLAAVGGVGGMLALCLVAGAGFAPGFTSIHSAMADAAPPEQSTEAFTWLGTVTMVGIGLGWALGGQIAQALAWQGCMLVSAALMAVGGALGLRMASAQADAR